MPTTLILHPPTVVVPSNLVAGKARLVVSSQRIISVRCVFSGSWAEGDLAVSSESRAGDDWSIQTARCLVRSLPPSFAWQGTFPPHRSVSFLVPPKAAHPLNPDVSFQPLQLRLERVWARGPAYPISGALASKAHISLCVLARGDSTGVPLLLSVTICCRRSLGRTNERCRYWNA